MIFNQLEFLFLFLPAVLLLSRLCRGVGDLRIWLLIAASFLFYGLSGLNHAVVLAINIVWVYLIAGQNRLIGTRLGVAAASVPPVLFLIYFKYTGFLVGTFTGAEAGASTPVLSFLGDVALPAGISFFTFQLVGYAIDRHRGEIPAAPGFSTFALFISFFPQLVAGPIVRYHEVKDALAAIPAFRLNARRLEMAIGYLVCGLAYKVLIADTLWRQIEPMVATPGALDSGQALYVILAYSFQIFADFYGYSLMAIGLGHLFGVTMPVNFDRPYLSLNPQEFWRRWHKTLSYWIRDYLFIPLGGREKYIRNIAITFAICGLWHGAGWSFVVWGLYHAGLVIGYRMTKPVWDAAPKAVQWAGCFSLVSLGWILFLFDFAGALAILKSLAGQGMPTDGALSPDQILILIVSAAICFTVRPEKIAESTGYGPGVRIASGIVLGIVFLAGLLFTGLSTDFIYFRF